MEQIKLYSDWSFNESSNNHIEHNNYDSNFIKALHRVDRDLIDADGGINKEVASTLGYIDISHSKIKSLNGIEYFTNLTIPTHLIVLITKNNN